MLVIEDIIEIKESDNKGYEIVFPNGIVRLNKRRTIVGLLLLIKYQICSEEDLTGINGRLREIKNILGNKINGSWIQERYGDANKPFSELWTEEMFTFIRAEGFRGNKKYVLDIEDHDKLFNEYTKSNRKQLSSDEQKTVLTRQNGRCNICGSILKFEITNRVFAKDRVRVEFDHRVPIDRRGSNDLANYQALCHYCNKCKRQMCYICNHEQCDKLCALVSPEQSSVVKATSENIEDRIRRF